MFLLLHHPDRRLWDRSKRFSSRVGNVAPRLVKVIHGQDLMLGDEVSADELEKSYFL
jgi:hypothetical protein